MPRYNTEFFGIHNYRVTFIGVFRPVTPAHSFSLAGGNLGDERYRAGGYNFPGAITGDSVIGFYGAPRTVTLSVTANF